MDFTIAGFGDKWDILDADFAGCGDKWTVFNVDFRGFGNGIGCFDTIILVTGMSLFVD